MPLDYVNQVLPQDQVPDTGDVRDLSPGNFPEVNIGNTDPLTLPELEETPTALGSTNYRTIPDYTVVEGLVAGFKDTSIAAMWNAFDTPDFEYDNTFKSEDALRYYQQSRSMNFSDDEVEKLLSTGSAKEFEHQINRFDEHRQNAAIAQQSPATYILGSIADVDSLVPFGLGKINRVVKLNKLQRAATVGAATGGVSYTAYQADEYTALSTADIAFQVSAMTAAGLLPELFRATKVAPDDLSTKVESRIKDFNPSGIIDESDDGSSLLERGDLSDPSTQAKSIMLDDVNGVTYMKDGDDYLAIHNGDTVGELSIVEGEVFVTVLPEMRGKGVGKELFKAFFQTDTTGAKAGSFTPAGKAAAESALKDLYSK